MKAKQFIKIIGKNIVAILVGGIAGVIGAMIYLFSIWIPTEGAKAGLAIIALIPVMMILFGMLGAIVGAVVGIVLYHTIRKIRKKRKRR